jgi:hypothetical protein
MEFRTTRPHTSFATVPGSHLGSKSALEPKGESQGGKIMKRRENDSNTRAIWRKERYAPHILNTAMDLGVP